MTLATIYIHVDPPRRELLYVGLTRNFARPYDFSSRTNPHRDRLRILLDLGYEKRLIVRIIADRVSWGAAVEIERQVIRDMQPRMNFMHQEWVETNQRLPAEQRLDLGAYLCLVGYQA